MYRCVLRALMVLGLIGAWSLALLTGGQAALASPGSGATPSAGGPDACARFATLQRADRYGIKVRPIARALADHHCRINPAAAKKASISEVGPLYSFRSNHPCQALATDNPGDGETNPAIAKLQAECVAEQVELVQAYIGLPQSCIQEVNLANTDRTEEPIFESAGEDCDADLESAGLKGGLFQPSSGAIPAGAALLLVFLAIVLWIRRNPRRS